MSNDVHLARVSKIQRSTDISKGELITNRRCIGRTSKEPPSLEARLPEDVEYLFGSISPRGGSSAQLPGEVESPDPDNTQRDTNESDNNISSCSTLDIVNKVDNLSFNQVDIQMRELSQRLQQAEEQRVEIQRQLEESNAEKELCYRRLEVISTAHECRITEMHCVIAELSKKLRAKQDSTILEEQEPEGSEISFQEGSIYNSELNLTNPDAECQTDPLDAGEYSLGEVYDNAEENFCDEVSLDHRQKDAVNKGQVEALQEEVLHLKAQIALLQSEIADTLHLNPDGPVTEPQTVEYFGENLETKQSNFAFASNIDKLNDLDFESPLKHYEPLPSPQKVSLVPKMAERVKLRCATKDGVDNITADLFAAKIENTDIVEYLVSDLKQNDSLVDGFIDPTQLDTELRRLQRKVDHLKAHNTVLSLTLDECKQHCEHLYLLCGKYESNAVALQLAVNCSDRAIEAYDVMLALLESKLALIKDKSVAAEESRKAVESVARHLLDRLESEKNMCENSLGPWQNTFSIPDKVCAPWTSEDDNRLRYHVSKLKGRRSTVQNTIVNLESPFNDLHEKSRLATEGSQHDCEGQEKTCQLDLEMAVLSQDCLNLREENIKLRSKIEETERERQFAMDSVGILQEALNQLQLQLSADASSLFQQEQLAENRISYSEAEHAALTERQLVEALTRESELKIRIQTLIGSVSAAQKLSDGKYEQLQSNLRDLQKSNLNLEQMLEQNKRKYQMRIRKLEQKVLETSMELDRHKDTQAEQTHWSKCKNVDTRPLNHDNVPETTL